MELIKSLLILSLLTVVAGQLLRLSFFENTALTLTDIAALATSVAFLLYALTIKKSIKLNLKTFVPFSIFIILAISSNVFATISLPTSQVLVSSLFLVRFAALFFISVITFNIISRKTVNNWTNLVLSFGLLFMLAGLLQLIFYPDLTGLVVYGWDPHRSRIVSTFLDPNFAGFMYVLIFTLNTSYLLFGKNAAKKLIYWRLILSTLAIAAIVLTLSRSSYLALITAIAVLGFIKSKRVFLFMLIFISLLFATIPQARDRIVGAVTIDDTAKARVLSWQNASFVFSQNPIFGVGFNTYRYTQYRYNLFGSDTTLGGHSGAGTDSSFLLVAATTGILGFAAYILFVVLTIRSVYKKAAKSPISLSATAIFISLLVHSQFVNSFFYPQIMLMVWFLIGLAHSYDS